MFPVQKNISSNSSISNNSNQRKRKAEDNDSSQPMPTGNALFNDIPRKKEKIAAHANNHMPQSMQIEHQIEKQNKVGLEKNITRPVNYIIPRPDKNNFYQVIFIPHFSQSKNQLSRPPEDKYNILLEKYYPEKDMYHIVIEEKINKFEKIVGPETVLINEAREKNNNIRKCSMKLMEKKNKDACALSESDVKDVYALSESDVEYIIQLYEHKKIEKKLHGSANVSESDIKNIVDMYMLKKEEHTSKTEKLQKDKWIVRNDIKNVIHMHESKKEKKEIQKKKGHDYFVDSESKIRDILEDYDGGEDLIEMLENYTDMEYEDTNDKIRYLHKKGDVKRAAALAAPYREAIEILIENNLKAKEPLLFRAVKNHNLFQEGEIFYEPAPMSFSILKEKTIDFLNSNPIVIDDEVIQEPPGAVMHAAYVEAANISGLSMNEDEAEALGKPGEHFDIIGKFFDEKTQTYQVIAKKIDKIKIPKKRRNSI